MIRWQNRLRITIFFAFLVCSHFALLCDGVNLKRDSSSAASSIFGSFWLALAIDLKDKVSGSWGPHPNVS